MKTTRINYKGFWLDLYYELQEEENQTLYSPKVEKEISILEVWINGADMIDLLYPSLEDIQKELEKELRDE
jgi:hypothetical protein